MAKVITFSRTFPSYHPRKGQPTHFVEAFYKSLYLMKTIPKELEDFFVHEKFINGLTKHHTIRAGRRFKKGDLFSPRVWGDDINPKSGKSGPYHSKQVILAQDTEIKQVWDIEINKDGFIRIGSDIRVLSFGNETKLAENDGLTRDDLFEWFAKLPFSGQIICWNENIKY